MNSHRSSITISHTVWLAMVVLTMGAFLLGSCRSKGTPEATQAPAATAPAAVSEVPVIEPDGGQQPIVTDVPYPGPQGGAPVVTAEPYPGPQVGVPVVTDNPYPAPDAQAPDAQAPAAASSPTAAAPTAGNTPAPTAADPDAYPGPTLFPTYDPYPGPDSQPTAIPTNNPYPGPSGAATATLPPSLPTNTPAVTAGPTGAATPTLSFQTSTTPTLQPTPFILTTPTPSPSLTPTMTPIPPTLDLAARLRATNPRSVKLVSGKIQLIEFFAYWDGPSKSMAPMMYSLETQYGEQVNFIYLDIDDPKNTAFKKSLYYRSQPELILLDGQGKVLKRWSGYVKRNELEKALLEVL